MCVGETLEQREAGATEKVVTAQVEGSLAGLSSREMVETVIAYEPVWAIGTGRTATPSAGLGSALIRGLLRRLFDEHVAQSVRIQYGGSMKEALTRAGCCASRTLTAGWWARSGAKSFADIITGRVVTAGKEVGSHTGYIS